MPVLQGLYALLAATPAVAAKLGGAAPGSIFITAAGKGAVAPYVVLHLVNPLPQSTLDGVSALRDGEIQFDSYGADPVVARALSQAVRSTLEGYGGELSDANSTTIQFVDTTLDEDDGYEQGGTGYLYRSLLRLQAFYTEH